MAVNKILIVDDSPTDLTHLKEAVSGSGARIISATNGNEAIEKARAEKPDLIFMDVVMDGLDGFGACREIVRADETRGTPVVFVTSKNQRADKMWGEKQGGKGMISKPYDKEAILHEIKRFS